MALPHSRVMIHQPMGGAQGQAEDIKVRQGRAGSGGCGFTTIYLLKESTCTDSKHVCPRKKNRVRGLFHVSRGFIFAVEIWVVYRLERRGRSFGVVRYVGFGVIGGRW